jgi:trimeric autotransporter adhesin
MIKKTIFLSLFVLTVLFSGCGNGNGDTGDTGNSGDTGDTGDTGDGGQGDCPGFATEVEKGFCKIVGGSPITEDITLTSDTVWLLEGSVTIGENFRDPTKEIKTATLTIEPGTLIMAKEGKNFLVINRGSKIIAEGTVEKPILFTSAKEEGERNRGDWGGILINGWAPVNCAGASNPCQRQSETGVEWYGGTDPDDDSGVIRFVAIHFGGYKINSEKEFNGLTFQGVGRKTVTEFVHVHKNDDDGVEWFGGTNDAKYIVVTGAADDSLDWTFGWSGRLQFAIVEKYDDEADRGIEADTNGSNFSDTPVSAPVISNLTIIGSEAASEGVILRAGTGGHINGTIVTGHRYCLNIDDKETFSYAEQGILKITNTILDCQINFKEDDQTDHDGNPLSDVWPTDGMTIEDWFRSQSGNLEANPVLKGWIPDKNSPARLNEDITPDDKWFDKVDFIGAIKDKEHDWTEFIKVHGVPE